MEESKQEALNKALEDTRAVSAPFAFITAEGVTVQGVVVFPYSPSAGLMPTAGSIVTDETQANAERESLDKAIQKAKQRFLAMQEIKERLFAAIKDGIVEVMEVDLEEEDKS